ncbi:hypothetical protein ACS0TY_002375 [Phlomoides rotata]
MEQSDFDSITTRVRHLRENIVELQRNYDQLTLNVKIGSPSVTQKERVQQAEPQQTFQVPESGKADSAYTSPSSKEKVHQVEPPQGFLVLGSGKTNSANTSSSSKLEETEHLASKPDVSRQPSISGVKEGEISLRPQKGPKRANINVTGVKSCWWFNNTWENLLKRIKFRPEHFITDVSEKYPRLWYSKERTPSMFADGTNLEHSPQFVLLHQVSGKSRNFQIRC